MVNSNYQSAKGNMIFKGNPSWEYWPIG